MSKVDVQIELTHRGENECFTHLLAGSFYEVAPLGYLRYAETDPQMGRTTTTIRLLPDELRIIRSGDVESQFTFRAQARTQALYRLSGQQLALAVETSRLDFFWHNGAGKIVCYYALFLDEQPLDNIQLEIAVHKSTVNI
jgi:uncharacterized beta-barrel protein YwiB (DUF1934 family)